jgi:hypothetical protein
LLDHNPPDCAVWRPVRAMLFAAFRHSMVAGGKGVSFKMQIMRYFVILAVRRLRRKDASQLCIL